MFPVLSQGSDGASGMPPETGDSLASDPVGHTEITCEPRRRSARHICINVSPVHPGVPVTVATQEPRRFLMEKTGILETFSFTQQTPQRRV